MAVRLPARVVSAQAAFCHTVFEPAAVLPRAMTPGVRKITQNVCAVNHYERK